jgi:hypothetical protein
MAVAGKDNSVSVISIISSEVVALLKGHTKVRTLTPSRTMSGPGGLDG